MNNIISSWIPCVDVKAIDVILPLELEGKLITLESISHRKIGYGHWQLSLDISIDGHGRHTLRAITTDTVMIDYWNGREHEFEGPNWLDPNYEGRIQAIGVVLNANQNLLIEQVA